MLKEALGVKYSNKAKNGKNKK